MKSLLSLLFIAWLGSFVGCGSTAESSLDAPVVPGDSEVFKDSVGMPDSGVMGSKDTSATSSNLPEQPNEVEFLLENKTESVITIMMHGETITPGWFSVLDKGNALNIFEQCSLCSCDSEGPCGEECPDLEPNYSEINPGGLVSRYWPGVVFPVEQNAEGICERPSIVPVNDLVARLCWWAGPKEIAPDAEKTCVDISFKAWEEIQVIHQVK